MEWNGNFRNAVSSRSVPSFNFVYNYNIDQYPGMGMKHNSALAETSQGIGCRQLPLMEMDNYNSQEKKKRLTSDQLDSLELSFQEEVKLDPDRKMKLSRELGLQPRQIAVWFQNRKARWKNKQLERLYDTLKREYDIVSTEKQKLQDEVMKLKSMLRDQVASHNKQVSTEISGEQTTTVESTSMKIRSYVKKPVNYQMAESNNLFNEDEYNNVPSPYWAILSSYP
ncbi:hypothetical protein ACFE04_020029 [Oxalis oulophora]